MIGDIASAATAVSVLVALFGLRQVFRGRQRQFESMYVQRYWLIIDRLSLDAMHGRQETAEDRRAAWAYLRLCEDELELRANGWIGDHTYRIWAESMRIHLEQPLFRDVWTELQAAAEDGTAFRFTYLSKLLADKDHRFDPCELSRWRRWIRGLSGTNGV